MTSGDIEKMKCNFCRCSSEFNCLKPIIAYKCNNTCKIGSNRGISDKLG